MNQVLLNGCALFIGYILWMEYVKYLARINNIIQLVKMNMFLISLVYRYPLTNLLSILHK